MKKHLLFIALAFIVGLSLSSVQAVSPFTEIGNLEMEVLDALNMIVEDLNAEIVRIDLLNSIQIAERSEQDGIQLDIVALQEQTRSLESGQFSIPGPPVNPTQERGVNGAPTPMFVPIVADFEFTSSRNHIVFTNGTITNIPGPHLLESFVNSVDVFFKERLENGTIVNHPLCSLTAGDSISECNLIGFNTTVVPQNVEVSFFVDSNADTNIYTVFDYESIFSITVTYP